MDKTTNNDNKDKMIRNKAQRAITDRGVNPDMNAIPRQVLTGHGMVCDH